MRRRDFRQWNGSFRVSPRPGVSWIRQVSLQGTGNHITNEQSGDWETRELGGQTSIEFENSDRFSVGYSYAWETLVEDARISGATILPGVYDFGQVDARLQLGPQRRIRGNLSFSYGDFFGGTLTSAGPRGGTGRDHPAVLVRAQRLVQLVRGGRGDVRPAPLHRAADIHALAARLRERARPVQHEQRRRERETSGSAGSGPRAASCSWCTRRTGAPTSSTGGPR